MHDANRPPQPATDANYEMALSDEVFAVYDKIQALLDDTAALAAGDHDEEIRDLILLSIDIGVRQDRAAEIRFEQWRQDAIEAWRNERRRAA